MNELRRLAYLQAMGTDAYISRHQMPGAAVTRRLAVVRQPGQLPSAPVGKEHQPLVQGKSLPDVDMPRIEISSLAPQKRPSAVTETLAVEKTQIRFRLAVVSAGGWLWLEELTTSSFTAPQQQLLQAIVEAVGLVARNPGSSTAAPLEVSAFDWPIHSNQQLDQGLEAARSGVAAFVQRKLEQYDSRGLVLLGETCEARMPVGQALCPRLVRTVGTADMLQDPGLKRRAWSDLRSLSGET